MIVAYFWSIKPSRLPVAIKAMGFDHFSLFRDKNVSKSQKHSQSVLIDASGMNSFITRDSA
jgi:hypothetical protein